MKHPRRYWLRVPLVQWRNPLWWAVWAVIIVGSWQMGATLWTVAVNIPEVLIPSAIAVAGLGTLWWWVVRWSELHAKAHPTGMLLGIAWGAGAATGVYALAPNSSLIAILGNWVDPDIALRWGAAIVAPLTEEVGKGLGIVAVLLLARAWARTPVQGAVVGALVGLGFELAELVLYIMNVNVLTLGEYPVITAVGVILLRGVVLGLFSHMLLSALVGAGIALLWPAHGRRRPVQGILAITLGFGLHALWNAQLGPFWLSFVWLVVFAALFFGMLKVWRRHEQHWFHEVMAAEVEAGTLDQVYVANLGRSRRQRRTYRKKVGRHYGMTGMRLQATLDHLMVDLADAVAAEDADSATYYRDAIGRHLAPATTST